jgi:predicted TIM-barrel fold metal-dependent hydrolase
MKVWKDLLEGLQVSLRGTGRGGAKNAQRRGNIMTRAYCRVLKAAEEARIDVLSHSGRGMGGHVREAG